MTFRVERCEDTALHQRMLDSINEELARVGAIIDRCGIPEAFAAQLRALEPARTGIPHDFELSIGWERYAYGARLSGWEWRAMGPTERISRVDFMVRAACHGLLDCVMNDRRAP